ncbi:EDSAP-1 family PEP-CTERM protein [Roseateles violae]|uniref:EDSAP-1 family PEP-CTERM protein n=1 Tax=Roseateles violae TaxID=3058042 RepID=A0ABT8DQY0_9BURK|nr:EDSAP-1 family PEP-CTERM protein [Pelomonas sp. PFR6]MDN3920438.1 EDSAP-1 family PEP-CTERM protein [Pelomonas sp. PFR6]
MEIWHTFCFNWVSAKAMSANRFTKDLTMTHFAKLKAVSALSAACAALFGAAPAHAYVYSLSHVEIQNVLLTAAAGTTINVSNFTFNEKNVGELNAVSTTQTDACAGVPGAPGVGNNCGGVARSGNVLDALVANAPGSTINRAENNFAFLGTGPGTYSNADSVLYTAQLVTASPTHLNQIAESLLKSNGAASASTLQQSNTVMSISFTTTGGGLSFSFQADPDMRVAINEGLAGLFSSQADMTASFTLTNSSGQKINWNPQGTGTNDCSAAFGACTESADAFDLNDNISAGFDGQDFSSPAAAGFGNFGINLSGLAAGNYTLALAVTTSTSITRLVNTVPEPGALALAGIALAGLGFTAKRRQNKQA